VTLNIIEVRCDVNNNRGTYLRYVVTSDIFEVRCDAQTYFRYVVTSDIFEVLCDVRHNRGTL